MLANTARSVARVASQRVAVRGFTNTVANANIPFGIGKWLGEESDHKIPTDQDRKTKGEPMPDFVPEDVRKDMEELGLKGLDDLEDLEVRNVDGYNDLGLVPPEDTGTFASPILIPSRRANRVVGYEDPTSHSMSWFTIYNDDSTYYVQDLGLFFKMLHIPDESAAHH